MFQLVTHAGLDQELQCHLIDSAPTIQLDRLPSVHVSTGIVGREVAGETRCHNYWCKVVVPERRRLFTPVGLLQNVDHF